MAKHFLKGMDVITNHTCLQAQSSEIQIILYDEQGMEIGKYITMLYTMEKW